MTVQRHDTPHSLVKFTISEECWEFLPHCMTPHCFRTVLFVVTAVSTSILAQTFYFNLRLFHINCTCCTMLAAATVFYAFYCTLYAWV